MWVNNVNNQLDVTIIILLIFESAQHVLGKFILFTYRVTCVKLRVLVILVILLFCRAVNYLLLNCS